MSGLTAAGPLVTPLAAPLVAGDIVRGTCRLLAAHGHGTLTEVTLRTGRRVDVMALAPDGGITVVEVKSSVQDFRSDRKWQEYLDFCDRFFFAVGEGFPHDILPGEPGLIVEITLNDAEKAAFEKSCGAVRELIDASKKLLG